MIQKFYYSLLLNLLLPIFINAQEVEEEDWSYEDEEEWYYEEVEETNKYECDTINFSITEINVRLKDKVQKALQYNKIHGLSEKYCILIDMGVHSGIYRLFVYDFKAEKIIKKALVSHGCGSRSWAEDYTRSKPMVSNTPESHLSSIGKYRIGKRGLSSWGIKVNYKMHGLDKTNNNAYKRIIVLHSWEQVNDDETFPEGTPEGWGCPAVSNNTMVFLDNLLQENKNVLMWLYI